MADIPSSRAPRVVDLSLSDFLNKFQSYRALDPANNQPKPDMIAARYALTGLSWDSQLVAGINTVHDKLGCRGTMPFIRCNFDSLIGFSTDVPVSKDVTYFPNPPPTCMLKKSVQVKYSYFKGEEVRKLEIKFQSNSLTILIPLYPSRCNLPGLLHLTCLAITTA